MVSGRLAALALLVAPVFAQAAGLDVETSKARLTKATVPAIGRQEAILEVERFGRFSITAESAQGTAVQVISKMSGPGDVDGVPGESNGRVDVFLDRGTYKVVLLSDERGSGNAKIAVHSFEEKHAPEPPTLVELKAFSGGLDDHEQMSFWLEIRERKSVAFEAAGRNLADMRFWKEGVWLVDRAPTISTVQPVAGKPLTVVRLWATLEPGLYLLTAYGGKSQPWAEQSNEHPFHLRFGIPTVGTYGRARRVTSEFGFDRYLVPGNANFFRLELPEAKPATIGVTGWNPEHPFSDGGVDGAIEKNSVPPAVDVRGGGYGGGYTLVTVTAAAGQPYVLQHFFQSWYYRFRESGAHWVSSVHSGPPNDSVDATAIIARSQFENEDYRTIAYADEAIEIGSKQGWRRTFNLLDTLTLFLEVKSPGKYMVEIAGEGVRGSAGIEPFFAGQPPKGYKSPRPQDGGGTHELDAGLHVLTVTPDNKGIATVTVKPSAGWLGGGASIDAGTPRAQVRFPRLSLDDDRGYGIWLSRQPGVDAGLVVRPLPLDLADPLPLAMRAGDEIAVPFRVKEDGVLTAIAEDGSALEISVDGGAWTKSANVKAGAPGKPHEVRVRYAGKETISLSLGFEATRLQKWTPLPPLPDTAKELLPDFPVLSEKRPHFMDVVRTQSASFVVKADAPALYRIESSGLLATGASLRTRTIPAFDRASQNGVGRNFLLQQYLREGEYQVTVAPEGRSQGRMGVHLQRTRILDGGVLEDGIAARMFVRAGEAVVYRFTIAAAGEYSLAALGLNRTFRARLEDADGWPIVPVNTPASFTRRFEKGSYRLVLLPEAVDARQVTRLVRIEEEKKREGHGPHAIETDQLVRHVWTEPVAGSPRAPDIWRFEMTAADAARIRLTGEMTGTLTRDGKEIAVVPPERGWAGTLEAGRYELAVTCTRTNNHVPYELSIDTESLLAGRSREVYPPAVIPVAVGRAGLVELSSFGGTDVRARLLTADGRELASDDDRPGDWNFHVALPLAPGAYKLAVESVGASDNGSVTVAMEMPEEKMQPAIALPAKVTVDPKQSVFVHPLSVGAKDDVLLVSAKSAESVGVALDRKEKTAAGDAWIAMGADVGREAHLEIPVDGGGSYRLRVWSVDRRGNPIEVLAASAAAPADASETGVSLVKIPGMGDRVAGAVTLERPGVVRLETIGAGVLRASVGKYEPAEISPDGLVSVPDRVLWLFGEGVKAGRVKIARVRVKEEPGEGLALRMPAHGRLTVDLPDGKGPVVAVVSARRGQPGSQVSGATSAFAGGPMAPALRTVVAASMRARDPIAQVWTAAPDGDALDEVRVRGFAFDAPGDGGLLAGAVEDAIAAGAARRISLGRGTHRLRLTGGDGVIALVHDGEKLLGVHGGTGGPLDETVETEAPSVTVVSIAGGTSRFRVEAMPLAPDQRTAPVSVKSPVERPAVAGGTLRLPFTAPAGASTLRIRGGAADPVVFVEGGIVAMGRDVALAPNATGFALVRHEPGWVLAFVEPAGDSGGGLWGDPARGESTTAEPPRTVTLSGSVHRIRVAPKVASVLHLRAASPAAVRITRGDGLAPEVEVFPRGVVLDAYLPGGAAEITLRALGVGAQLSGGAELEATAVTPVGEGLGPEVLLPAGETRVFSFTVGDKSEIGIGVRADSDVVDATLLDATGKRLGTGVVQMRTLDKGTYFLSLHVAEDAAPARVRAAVVGLKRPDDGPPADVVRRYLEEAGVKKSSEIAP